MNLVKEHASNQEVLRVLFSSLLFMCKIFNSLNAQVYISVKNGACGACQYIFCQEQTDWSVYVRTPFFLLTAIYIEMKIIAKELTLPLYVTILNAYFWNWVFLNYWSFVNDCQIDGN